MATKKKLVTRYLAFDRDIFTDTLDDLLSTDCVDTYKEEDLSIVKRDYDFYVEVKGARFEEAPEEDAENLGTIEVKE